MCDLDSGQNTRDFRQKLARRRAIGAAWADWEHVGARWSFWRGTRWGEHVHNSCVKVGDNSCWHVRAYACQMPMRTIALVWCNVGCTTHDTSGSCPTDTICSPSNWGLYATLHCMKFPLSCTSILCAWLGVPLCSWVIILGLGVVSRKSVYAWLACKHNTKKKNLKSECSELTTNTSVGERAKAGQSRGLTPTLGGKFYTWFLPCDT